ncbi:hypothetical protein ACJMK2_007462 [Sinanodonta woodiana]|uniref:non-specific serine/threonine protein kinase n=1 Tax=Sinanodonta woodiana TaxID=1069815 RepID=A0ABD3VL39_SINWO
MGNQLTGIAPSQILPVEQYLTEVPEYQFEGSLGSTRFFKVAKARTKEGSVVVKVFVIHDPSLPLAIHKEKLTEIYLRLQGTSNCVPFQRAEPFEKFALLIRQYVKDSLYDRISTRPFLNKIEKKWIAFQLLCALNQCHKLKVCHGDIKSENVMITGWNWLLLTDFASFKPTYLPEDNPSDFSYFFDTSRRRTCYIAPERFVESSYKCPDTTGQTNNLDLTSSEVKTGDLTPAMDIFSAGCVITELFTEGTPPFDLSQLLSYRSKDYSPWKVLEKIDDVNIRDLVRHMMQKDPAHRLSAEEYLIQQRGKSFPEYFYTFLKIYIQRFATPPILTPDDRIARIKRDMDQILKSLGINESNPEENTGLVLIISLVGSSTREAHFCHSKLLALNLLLDLSKYVTPDIVLDRIIPYMINFISDKFAQVRALTIRSVTLCLANLKSVPRSDSNIFLEYIFPNLASLTQDRASLVRAAYAENIAQLAETALSVLEMTQLHDLSGESEEADAADMSSYDTELQSLQEIIQQKVVGLLSDSDNAVKQTLMTNGITRLCVFFGRQKANDILLSHMITFLNDKDDWYLRGSFFENIIGVAVYIGWQSSAILKPLIEQGLSDSEEYVVHKSLCALKALAELGLLQKNMLREFVQIVVPLLAHPDIWIRQGSVGFISGVAKILNIADIHCNLLPAVRPFLKEKILQVQNEMLLLSSLEDPIPRSVYDYILRSQMIDRVFGILQERKYMREIKRQGHKPIYSELDDTMAQIFRKLTSLGMTESHEDKILAMKELMLKLHKSRAGSTENSTSNEGRDGGKVGEMDIQKLRIVRRHADLYKQKDIKADGQTSPSIRRNKKSPTPETPPVSMNEDWKRMFGSTESDKTLSSSPKSRSVDRRASTATLNQNSTQSSIVAVSQVSLDGSLKVSSQQQGQQTRYAPCKLDLRTLVHKRRSQYQADIASKELEGISWENRPPPTNWKPKGQLVAHLQEHRGPVNRIAVCHNHNFFATCSNDGTVKIWECGRLEGKNVANRSKQTLNKQGGSIKHLAFLEGSTNLAAASDNGYIFIYALDSGKATQMATHMVDLPGYGQVVDMTHFDTGSQSVLAYATVSGVLIGWDHRSPELAWKLKNDPKMGLITSFDVHQSQCWLALGTSSGTHICWDLRFGLPITSIAHPTGARVRRLLAHPQEQSWIVSATQGNNEVSLWDMETGSRRKTMWASSVPTFSKTKANMHAVHGMHLSVTDSNVFLLTGGSDMRIRFWDLSYPANSFIMAGAAGDSIHQTSVSYRSRLVEGTEVIEETCSKKQTTNEDIPRRGPEAPPIGHTDTITDINICQASQCLVLSSSRNGIVKVWK